MVTAPAFTALLTFGVWGGLPAKRQAIDLELIRELDHEDRDRFALLFVVRSGHFHRFDCTKRKRTAKDERNASKKSRICPTLADLGLIVEKAYDRR